MSDARPHWRCCTYTASCPSSASTPNAGFPASPRTSRRVDRAEKTSPASWPQFAIGRASVSTHRPRKLNSDTLDLAERGFDAPEAPRGERGALETFSHSRSRVLWLISRESGCRTHALQAEHVDCLSGWVALIDPPRARKG